MTLDDYSHLAEALRDPVGMALTTTHAHFAICKGRARKYPAAVAPFAALAEQSAEAVEDLLALLEPGETTYVVGEQPANVNGVTLRDPLPCLQMLYPADRPLPLVKGPTGPEVVRLSWTDAAAMVELTDVAYPGYFRLRTCEMGSCYGVWEDGRLIAMAGERLCLNPLREVSGVCTLPEYRTRGLATRLMAQVMHDHRRDGHISWLYVVSTNQRAIDLYLRMGFQIVREVQLHGVSLA